MAMRTRRTPSTPATLSSAIERHHAGRASSQFAESDWLIESGTAGVLESSAQPDDGRNDARIVVHHDLARALLRTVPDEQLAASRMWDGPVLREMLTAVAHHPARAEAYGWVNWDYRESLTLNSITIHDPDFVGLVPDITLGPLPSYFCELDPELREQCVKHRNMCLRSSVVRQQWHRARSRYGLHSARSAPLRPDLDCVEMAVVEHGAAFDGEEAAIAIGELDFVTFRWR